MDISYTEYGEFDIIFENFLFYAAIIFTLLFALAPTPKLVRGYKDREVLELVPRVWVLLKVYARTAASVIAYRLNFEMAFIAMTVNALLNWCVISYVFSLTHRYVPLIITNILLCMYIPLLLYIPVGWLFWVALILNCFATTLGPLDMMYKTVMSKDSKYCQVPMLCLGYTTNFIWFVYGIRHGSMPITISNMFGQCAISITMLAYLWSEDVIPWRCMEVVLRAVAFVYYKFACLVGIIAPTQKLTEA